MRVRRAAGAAGPGWRGGSCSALRLLGMAAGMLDLVDPAVISPGVAAVAMVPRGARNSGQARYWPAASDQLTTQPGLSRRICAAACHRACRSGPAVPPGTRSWLSAASAVSLPGGTAPGRPAVTAPGGSSITRFRRWANDDGGRSRHASRPQHPDDHGGCLRRVSCDRLCPWPPIPPGAVIVTLCIHVLREHGRAGLGVTGVQARPAAARRVDPGGPAKAFQFCSERIEMCDHLGRLGRI